MVKIFNWDDISKDDLRELQLKELEILKYFKKICKSEDLQFFLGGGSCIGAVRDKGFVPWDDDVDVFMPRKDYEYLAANWPRLAGNSKYDLCKSDKTHNYRHSVATLNDNTTTFINLRTKDCDINQGIFIDIIPMDQMAKGSFRILAQRMNAILFSIFINQRLPDNQGKLLKVLTNLPLSLVKSSRLRYNIWKNSENKMINYSDVHSSKNVELVTGLKAIFRPLNAGWFSDVKWIQFEDDMMPVPIGYDQYLSLIFGNYMELPPKNQQHAKHNIVLIDTDNSYLDYKGKYYLKED